jgi:fumarate hydratase subunit alpha
MREVHVDRIVDAVRQLAISANIELGDDVVRTLEKAIEREESPTGRDILMHLIRNAEVAKEQGLALCQDTGMAVIFAEIGQDVHVTGGALEEAINEGVRRGYSEGYLRKSMRDPFSGKNTGDNTPAIIHYSVVPGDRLCLKFLAKGGGGENMSRVTAVTPGEGLDGCRRFAVECVREAGANPCPPTIVGVGIGGTMERAAMLAKKALLRPLGEPNPDKRLVEMEAQWLDEINRLGIGPQGLGGRVTSLAVHILAMPHHIAGIPVAVNIQCHSSRHKEVQL